MNLGAVKRYGKKALCKMFEAQVQRLRVRHSFTVVAVAGSVGKTSTKAAIAQTIAAGKRVAWQQGNYNDRLTVPLIFFDQEMPSLFNLAAWAKIYVANERIIRGEYPYDVVVVELGTDGPGQIAEFAYLKPELVVLTAVTPEHMEYFKTLDAVAKEETTALTFAKQSLVNVDDVEAKFLRGQTFAAYGFAKQANYRVESLATSSKGQKLRLHLKGESVEVQTPYLGAQGAKIVLAAAAAAHTVGLSKTEIVKGLDNVRPFAGRMQLFEGVNGTTLIDDTYNSSPVAAKAALDVLYAMPAPQRIAVLGNMNELGDYSAEAHREIGEYCDPKKLDLVIVIGPEAEEFLAPAAKARGNNVQSFVSPHDAAELLSRVMKARAVVLFKGSQNRVFAEEALKPLLANEDDAQKLVRQSSYWMNVKRKQFGVPNDEA